VSVSAYPLGAACPTLLEGSDNLVVALCTAIVGQAPMVYLIDPADSAPIGHALAALPLAKGSLLGGVYAYLDDQDRLVVVDGNNRLLRVGHARDAAGAWRLVRTEVADLSALIPVGDNVTGLVQDWSGNVWFATGKGVVGLVGPSGQAATLVLPAGEQVANSISAAPSGRIAVAGTHALYELREASGRPEVLWRAAYERGSARNQLGHRLDADLLRPADRRRLSDHRR
jgi:streptogramin lyase